MPIPSYTGQTFVPQPPVSKAIAITNPNTGEVINLSAQAAAKEAAAAAAAATTTTPVAPVTPAAPAAAAAPVKVEEAPKEIKTVSRAIKIVNPKVSFFFYERTKITEELNIFILLAKGGRG